MKKPIDITLSTIHVGSARRVVTLAIDGKDLAYQFLSKLRKDDCNQWKFIKKRIIAVSEHDTFENRITFSYVGDGVFEFKRPGLRLYAFYDEVAGMDHLILCTNGGTKNNKKEQNKDIEKAISIKSRYFEAKQIATTTISLETFDE